MSETDSICQLCNQDSSQAELQQHLEQIHVGPQLYKEIVVQCSSCPFRTSAADLSFLINHGKWTGHGIESGLKICWDNFLESEASRIQRLVIFWKNLIEKNSGSLISEASGEIGNTENREITDKTERNDDNRYAMQFNGEGSREFMDTASDDLDNGISVSINPKYGNGSENTDENADCVLPQHNNGDYCSNSNEYPYGVESVGQRPSLSTAIEEGAVPSQFELSSTSEDSSFEIHPAKYSGDLGSLVAVERSGESYPTDNTESPFIPLSLSEEMPIKIESQKKNPELIKSNILRVGSSAGGAIFTCDICGKTMNYKSVLATHSKIHSSKKAFECRYCAKKFSRSANCWRHERVHTGERPYPCRFCQRSFSHSHARKRHESSRHSMSYHNY